MGRRESFIRRRFGKWIDALDAVGAEAAGEVAFLGDGDFFQGEPVGEAAEFGVEGFGGFGWGIRLGVGGEDVEGAGGAV